MTATNRVYPQAIRLLEMIGMRAISDEVRGRSDVRIGIIDGPVHTEHPDLRDARWGQVNPSAPVACVDRTSIACLHGTFVAGMLAARADSDSPGLCPTCTFLVRPIFHDTGGNSDGQHDGPSVDPDELAAALVDTVEAGAHIINLSLGLSAGHARAHPSLVQAFDLALARGVLLVGASGNQRRIGALPLFEHLGVIPVAACDAAGHVLPRCNLGQALTRRGLMAPGENIRSTTPLGGTTTLTGTSFAAPFVTGALALLWSRHPRATADQLRAALLRPGMHRRSIVPPLLNVRESDQILHRWHTASGQISKVKAMNSAVTTNAPAITLAGVTTPEPGPSKQPPVTPQDGDSQPYSSQFSYVYTIGKLRADFPSEGVRRQFMRALGKGPLAVPDNQELYSVLKDGQNLYLARSMRWIMTVNDVDTYAVLPSSDVQLHDMIEALKPQTGDETCDVVIGKRFLTSDVDMPDMLTSVVECNRFYYFTVKALVNSVAKDTGVSADSVYSTFEILQRKSDNVGESPEARAVNYLALRYSEVYKMVSKLQSGSPATSTGTAVGSTATSSSTTTYSLVDVLAEPARVQGGRDVVDVTFKFEPRGSGSQVSQVWSQCKVDVTGQYPFLVQSMTFEYPRP